jgi:hypothetical protein
MSYEWLRFVDLDRIATDEEREKLMGMITWTTWLNDNTYRDIWSERFMTYRLKDIIFSYAVITDNCQMIRFVANLNAKRNVPDNCSVGLYDLANDEKTRIFMIDIGIESRTDWHLTFKKSRIAARSGAIAAMGAIGSRLRREQGTGMKDISRIIGRLVWESRKYYLSEEMLIHSKRIKNE